MKSNANLSWYLSRYLVSWILWFSVISLEEIHAGLVVEGRRFWSEESFSFPVAIQKIVRDMIEKHSLSYNWIIQYACLQGSILRCGGRHTTHREMRSVSIDCLKLEHYPTSALICLWIQ